MLLCLDGINNIIAYKNRSFTRQDPQAVKFAKDLNQLVVEMAVANSELVDLFFLTRYLSRLAQFRDLNQVLTKAQ